MSSEKKTKKSKLKTIIIIFLILIALLGIGYFKSQKDMNDRREAVEEQRQVMIDSWKDQELSDEEIQEKLKTQRPEGSNPGEDPSLFQSIFRVISGGGGPGTGDGKGPGRMMR